MSSVLEVLSILEKYPVTKEQLEASVFLKIPLVNLFILVTYMKLFNLLTRVKLKYAESHQLFLNYLFLVCFH